MNEKIRCPVCFGAGEMYVPSVSTMFNQICPKCKGTGEILKTEEERGMETIRIWEEDKDTIIEAKWSPPKEELEEDQGHVILCRRKQGSHYLTDVIRLTPSDIYHLHQLVEEKVGYSVVEGWRD